jgi:hypothetical protein
LSLDYEWRVAGEMTMRMKVENESNLFFLLNGWKRDVRKCSWIHV